MDGSHLTHPIGLQPTEIPAAAPSYSLNAPACPPKHGAQCDDIDHSGLKLALPTVTVQLLENRTLWVLSCHYWGFPPPSGGDCPQKSAKSHSQLNEYCCSNKKAPHNFSYIFS